MRRRRACGPRNVEFISCTNLDISRLHRLDISRLHRLDISRLLRLAARRRACGPIIYVILDDLYIHR